MLPASVRHRLYRTLKPWADRLYLWLRADTLALGGPTGSSGGPQPRVITSFGELDAELDEIDRLFSVSDDEARARLAAIKFAPPLDFPDDPYSAAYAAAQMQNYLKLSGRSAYISSVNEHSSFDLESAKRHPFPYLTKSPTTVGNQLVSWGALVQALDLPPGATIVEYGPGWGNTTVHLAQMGYALTAVEIEPDFVRLIQHRAAALGVSIETVQADMLSFVADQPFDCALFFESFHHCADHLQMLRNLDRVVKPGGLLAFGAEPITSFAHPWGFVRQDGLTAWSIRRQGWFELGFDSSYFLRTLLYFGWLPRRNPAGHFPGADVIVARRAQGRYAPHALSLPPDEETGWHAPEDGYRFTHGKAVLSCARFQPVGSVSVCLRNHAAHALTVSVTAGANRANFDIPPGGDDHVVTLGAKDWQGQVTFASPTWQPGAGRGKGDPRTLGIAVVWVELMP